MRRLGIALVYGSGLAQGVALVAFPAAGNVFRDPNAHALTSAQYGGLFLPMFACAIVAASGAGLIARRIGMKRVFLIAFAANIASMALLASSQLAIGHGATAYHVLLAAIAALGIGFGSTLTAINAYAPRFFPQRTDMALTMLHALVGVGTALPPLTVPSLAMHGIWWALAAAMSGIMLILGVVVALTPLPADPPATQAQTTRLSSRFWWLAAAAALYGICEAMFGNWGTIYLHEEAHLPVTSAGLALAVFWAMVTAGRLLVAGVSVWVPSRRVYMVLPLMLCGTLVIVPMLAHEGAAVATFAAGGLGCSAFLPLTIGFSTAEAGHAAELGAGLVLAAFLLGSGIGTFGVGPLHESAGLPLARLYLAAAGIACAVAALAVVLTRRRPVAL